MVATIAAEHTATRERVAMFDMTPFAKFELAGPGALAALQRLAANQMDKPVGRVTYTSMLTFAGGIKCDLTVTRLAEERFMIVTGGAIGLHDLDGSGRVCRRTARSAWPTCRQGNAASACGGRGRATC